MSHSTVAEQVAICRSAQHAWSRVPLRERLRIIRLFRQSLVGACDMLCSAVQSEVGRSPEETVAAEILRDAFSAIPVAGETR